MDEDTFCPKCNNLLMPITLPDKFYYECGMCKEQKVPKNFVIYEDIDATSLQPYKILLDYAGKDHLNPKEIRYCEKCKKKTIVRQVRIGEDMRLFNTCVTCETQWIENNIS